MSPKATILVVDDEPNIIELGRLYLQNEGYNVEAAHDGLEALRQFEVLKPALIVLDLMLPGMDGWEVCRTLRRESEMPIIMLTARAEESDRPTYIAMVAEYLAAWLAGPFEQPGSGIPPA